MAEEKVATGASLVQLVTRAEAKAAGLKRYYPGRPCKHGHLSEYDVMDARCLACLVVKDRKYRKANPDKVRASDNAHYQRTKARHKETRLAREEALSPEARAARDTHRDTYLKSYRERNVEKRRFMMRRWLENLSPEERERLRQKSNASSKKWQRENRDRANASVTRYRKRHPELAAHHGHVQRTKRRSAKQGDRKQIRKFLVWLRTAKKVTCYYCRKTVPKVKRVADHIIPLAKGGANDAANLCAACAHCNAVKWSKSAFEFAGQAEMELAA